MKVLDCESISQSNSVSPNINPTIPSSVGPLRSIPESTMVHKNTKKKEEEKNVILVNKRFKGL